MSSVIGGGRGSYYMTLANPPASRPRVVIAGAGFGGLAAAKRLAKQPVDVTMIDKRNYHLFQPLLYQVATAALSPADMVWPIRSIFANSPNIRVVLGNVRGIDCAAHEVVSDRLRSTPLVRNPRKWSCQAPRSLRYVAFGSTVPCDNLSLGFRFGIRKAVIWWAAPQTDRHFRFP